MLLARWLRLLGACLVLLALSTAVPGRADTIVLKNGNVYRGVVDKDNTLVSIFDGLKRVVIRDSKIARIEPDASFRNLEWFKIEQPLVVHGGSMPKEVSERQGRALERQGPPPVPVRCGAVGQAGEHGAGDQRDGPLRGQAPGGRRLLAGPARDQPGPARGRSWPSSPRSSRATRTSGCGSPGS